jgi:hypothetical protein
VTDIQVSCEPSTDGWRCSVRVTEDGRTSTFDVTTRDPGALLPPGGTGSRDADVERLVSETFAFLLEREPVSSILSSFDLTVVTRYFPEYPTEIRLRLAG